MRRQWFITVSLLFAFSFLSLDVTSSQSQPSQSGKINGTVKDPIDTVIPGAQVTVRNETTGAILEVEEEITLDSLSPPVRAEVEKNIGGAKLLRLESVTKGAVLTGYEVTVSRAGKKSGLEMGTDGKLLPKEKKSK